MDIRLVYNCTDMPIKIIIAPQSFKGGLFALAAAQAIERGVLAADPDAETVLVLLGVGRAQNNARQSAMAHPKSCGSRNRCCCSSLPISS